MYPTWPLSDFKASLKDITKNFSTIPFSQWHHMQSSLIIPSQSTVAINRNCDGQSHKDGEY